LFDVENSEATIPWLIVYDNKELIWYLFSMELK